MFKEKFNKTIPLSNNKEGILNALEDLNDIETIIQEESEEFNFPVFLY